LPELQTRRQRAEEHGQVLRARLHEIEQQQMDRTQELRLVQGLEEFCTSMHSALQNPEYEIKQKVLQLVVDRIVVDEQQLTIRHVVPTGSVKLQTGPQIDKTQYPVGQGQGIIQGEGCLREGKRLLQGLGSLTPLIDPLPRAGPTQPRVRLRILGV